MMKLSPKVLTGSLHQFNKGACDWGWQGLLAHGCHTCVVVIDPKTVQTIQVLGGHGGHKSYVTKLRWAHENYHHDIGSPYTLRLASADHNGTIIVWDVSQGSPKAEFTDSSRPIQDLQWVTGQDASRDLLVVLHPPYSLVLWNGDTGTKLWKKSYTETLLSFAFDPFDPKQVAFLGQDCIVFIHDFTITKVPSSNGKKFYISSPSSPGNSGSNAEKQRGSRTLAKRMSRILVGEVKQSNNKSDEESVNLNECIQLTYHPACRHHLILLYPREVLILDLEINQTVGTIPMERTGSPFLQIIPCRQRDAMMCLHENGSVTMRVRRKTNVICTPASEGTGAFDDTPPHVSLDVAYDLRCQSDTMRLTKHNKVYGVAMSPVSERAVSLVMSDSRVLFWEVKTVNVPDANGNHQAFSSPLYTPGASLADFSQLDQQKSTDQLPIISDVAYPKLSLCDLIGQPQNAITDSSVLGEKKHTVVMKFLLTGLICGVTGQVSVIRMCPPLTTKNWSYYQPLLAIGTQQGYVQIFNLSSGQLDKEYSVHTSVIRGIEWVNLSSFISFAYPTPGTSNLVKSEVMLVDILSGKVTPLRTNKDEGPPIEFIRVSCLKQYFAICFKDKPFELWDMKTLTLLREMPKHFPHVTALEWSPSHAIKTLKRRLLQRHDSPQIIPDSPAPTITDPSGSDTKSSLKSSPKEHVILTDTESVVYHFIVEGSSITDSSKIPAEPGMAVINSIAWKGDQIIYGDVDGHINIWDLKNKKSKYFPTNRGWVKKIRFAPGRGNMRFLALFTSGLEIWDAVEGQSLFSLKSPKDVPKIIDAEWACSDKPVIATEDGCVRVMDLKLTTASSGIEERELADPLFCPHVVSAKASLLVKCLLQHQPWNEKLSLDLEGVTDNDQDLQTAVNQQLSVLDQEFVDYLPWCKFGTAHRCLLTARLFGDESEVHFWTVALHYLRTEKTSPSSKVPSRISSQTESTTDMFVPPANTKETNGLVVFDSGSERELTRSPVSESFRDQPLERCYDVLCDRDSFQKYQLDRVALHDSKRATYEHTRKCAETYILLGQTDRAVQLLLETESDNDLYYVDSLRACLVASIRSSGASQSTIKLVATNLIANGKLAEGVQLLCLIDKGLDACRYLQTYGAWHQAAWLAKASLEYSEYSEVMKRWADHLCGPHANQKSKAVLVMLSLGQLVKVLEMLYGMRHFDRAVCFVEACMEFGLMEKTEETSPLIEAVFLEYARYLTNLRHRTAAEYYCNLAGEKGTQFLKEIDILFA